MAARLYIFAVPIAALGIGASMNQAVFIANSGKFPVMINDKQLDSLNSDDDLIHFLLTHKHSQKPREDGMIDLFHCRMTDKTHLNWLGDYINLHTVILSPGDLLIQLGVWLATYSSAIWITLAVSDYARTHERQRALALD